MADNAIAIRPAACLIFEVFIIYRSGVRPWKLWNEMKKKRANGSGMGICMAVDKWRDAFIAFLALLFLFLSKFYFSSWRDHFSDFFFSIISDRCSHLSTRR